MATIVELRAFKFSNLNNGYYLCSKMYLRCALLFCVCVCTYLKGFLPPSLRFKDLPIRLCVRLMHCFSLLPGVPWCECSTLSLVEWWVSHRASISPITPPGTLWHMYSSGTAWECVWTTSIFLVLLGQRIYIFTSLGGRGRNDWPYFYWWLYFYIILFSEKQALQLFVKSDPFEY